MSLDKQYLGDGVYVGVSGLGLVLTTENGISVTNKIVLEPEVLHGLMKYLERRRAAMREAKP
jgi:hypothetical protein